MRARLEVPERVAFLARANEIDVGVKKVSAHHHAASRWGRSTQDLVQTLDDLHG